MVLLLDDQVFQVLIHTVLILSLVFLVSSQKTSPTKEIAEPEILRNGRNVARSKAVVNLAVLRKCTDKRSEFGNVARGQGVLWTSGRRFFRCANYFAAEDEKLEVRKRRREKANLNLKTSSRVCWWIIDRRFIWHRYGLFTPLVTLLETGHKLKVATVHNIHVGAGSGPPRSRRAPAPPARVTFPSTRTTPPSNDNQAEVSPACFGTHKEKLIVPVCGPVGAYSI